MTDVAAVHEVTAIADPGDAAAGDGPGVHGHRFSDGAHLADSKLGELAAMAQGLRRRAQRNKRVDGAAGADGGLRADVDMPNNLAVRADDDAGADEAVWTDRRARADHSAILDSRGGIYRHPNSPTVGIFPDPQSSASQKAGFECSRAGLCRRRIGSARF